MVDSPVPEVTKTDAEASKVPDYLDGFRDGLRSARDVVERQTSLPELVHFERPSDFRKGVLTCLVALDNAIKEANA